MSNFQPARFGKYLLLDKFATGGMAELYLAKITGIQGFERLIAIKKILPHIAQEKELVNAFIDEAKLAALLNHQNVVHIYDFGSAEDSYFISMEYLFGKNLQACWRQARDKEVPISLENALYIVSRVCSGLAYAHELKDFQGNPLNIIHRDISPQNIFITYEGDVKILDFGIAKAASQSTVTQFGMIKGKVAYMSPEQAAGKPVDQRSDLFSVGILLYELVTKNRMFTGDSTIQILTKVRDDEYDSPESVALGLPPRIYAILNKAVAKEPQDRYQSCSQMFADLEECMIELSLRPTGRGLARYMKELFGEEIADEDQVIRQLSGIGRTQEAQPQSPVLPEEADAAEGSGPSQEPRRSERKQEPRKVEQPEPPKQARQATEKVTAPPPPEPKSASLPGGARNRKRMVSYAGAAALIVIIGLTFVLWPRGKGPEPSSQTRMPSAGAPVVSPSQGPSAPTAQAGSQAQPEKARENATRAKALRDQAGTLVAKEPEKAKTLLLQAIDLDPTVAEGYFRLGLAYVKLKAFPDAIETYRKVAAIDPQFPDIFFNLGFAYAMNKDYVRAEEMYEKVVALAPRYVDEALFNLAMVQEKQAKTSQAVANLEKALAANPKNETVKRHVERLKNGGEKKK